MSVNGPPACGSVYCEPSAERSAMIACAAALPRVSPAVIRQGRRACVKGRWRTARRCASLRRIEPDQGIVCRLRDGAIDRNIAGHRRHIGVALVFRDDGVHRFEHGDVDDCHGAAGAMGTELLAENPVFTWCHRRVVDGGRVQRNLVPHEQAIERAGRRTRRTVVLEHHLRLSCLHLQQLLQLRRACRFKTWNGRSSESS